MPVEHEYKYVLDMTILRDNQVWHVPHNICEIQQGYISPETVNLRVRKKTQYFRTEWYLTLKQKVDGCTMELEFDIDSRDGEGLWKICGRKLTKCRHTFQDAQNGSTLFGWEVDVFFTADRWPYFVMAEVEMPENAPPPPLPEWLRKYVLYQVPLTDDRFSNKMMCDVQYATELYRTFTKQGGRHGRHETED